MQANNELLTKLAPYLPYRIEVQYQIEGAGEWPTLKDELTTTLLDRFLDSPQWVQFDKPILRDFSQLTTPILHKEVEVIPAIEVAKLVLGIPPIMEVNYSIENFGNETVCVTASYNGEHKDTVITITERYNIIPSVYCAVFNQVAIVDLLRSMHFALPPFKEGEYILKE